MNIKSSLEETEAELKEARLQLKYYAEAETKDTAKIAKWEARRDKLETIMLVQTELLLKQADLFLHTTGEGKSYVVTHWQSGLQREVTYSKGDSFKRFLLSVGIAFNAGHVTRLYALFPNCTHEERVKIDTLDVLNSMLQKIDTDNNNLEILYIYPEEQSPTSSPSKGLPPTPREEPDSSDTTSTKSDRSTYQKRFKKELVRRDKSQCLLCSSVNALIGAHIVDAEAKLSREEKEALDMDHASDRYAVYNGLLLCANCHTMYDNWQLGIDDDGYLITWVKGGWERDENVNVYPDPSDKKSSPKNPLSVLLKWKYEKFVSKRDKKMTRLYNGMRGLFSSPTKSKKK